MKKGKSYIVLDSNKHTNHALVKALLNKGYKDFELTFYPKFSPDCGWNCDGYNLPTWIGYTKQEALKAIEKLECIAYVCNTK